MSIRVANSVEFLVRTHGLASGKISLAHRPQPHMPPPHGSDTAIHRLLHPITAHAQIQLTHKPCAPATMRTGYENAQQPVTPRALTVLQESAAARLAAWLSE